MFQTRLKELREAAGYKSQQAFADAFGVAQSTVGNWEAGKREPNYAVTIRLAQFFGVSVDSLINDGKGDLAMDTFGKRLTAKREELSISQEDLAERLSITPAQLNYWEKDQDKPPYDKIEAIATELGVMVDYLMGKWTEDMYVDYKNADEKDKLYLFNKWGVPYDLIFEYHTLCHNISEKSKQPTADDLYLIELLHRAEPEDKVAVQSILKKYENVRNASNNAG